MALIAIVQVWSVQSALQSSVSETVKVVAVHAYPAELLFREADSRWNQGGTGQKAQQLLGKIRTAREKAQQVRDFVDDYTAYIPDSLLPVIEWAARLPEAAEDAGRDGIDTLKKKAADPLLNAAFTPLVRAFADSGVLRKDSLQVTKVCLPDLQNGQKAFFGLEATYAMRLPIPFVHKELHFTKKAYERIWVGN
jgi:hypothetical protein